MHAPQSRSGRLSLLFCGALLLTTCGGDDDGAASAETDASGTVDHASDDDGSGDGVEDDASEGGEASEAAASEDDGTPGRGPANGTMVVDGEEFEPAAAGPCPPRDFFDPDNQHDSAGHLVDLRAETEDRLTAIRVSERLIDGVISHRLGDGSATGRRRVGEPLLGVHRRRRRAGFPRVRDRGRCHHRGRAVPSAGSEDPTLVTASWDVPDGFLDEDWC